VGIINPDVFLPIKYLAAPLACAELLPADLDALGVATDYQFAFARPAVSCDDLIPFSAAWRAIPWLEACCGCPVRCSSGSLAPGHFVASLAGLDAVPVPADDAWPACLHRETERLAATAPGDCWISPSILRGPSDALAAMRGQAAFFCDLYDGMDAVDRAAGRINELLVALLDRHFSVVRPKYGGFGHIYGYWSPGPTIVIQEDALGQCAPAVYSAVFQKYNAQIVDHLGPHVFFHLHSTGMRHWRDVLAIRGLAGLEVTVEANGPPLPDLLPVLREILEKARLILFVDHGFEHLGAALRQLPGEGLYLLLRDDQVRNNDEFRQFVKTHWGSE
jgi:hypothetical protein